MRPLSRWLIIFSLLFFALAPTASWALQDFGQECTENDDCESGGCEEVKYGPETGKYFCDCGDTALDAIFTSADDDYCTNKVGPKNGKTGAGKCMDGTKESGDIDYCTFKDGAVYPLGEPIAVSSTLINTVTKSLKSTPLTESELQQMLAKPVPKITLPGLKFSEPKIEQNSDGSKFVIIPFLGEYLAAVYRYAVVAISVIAVVMLIVAGVQWMLPDAGQENINAAKARIGHALIGLMLAVGSYTVLYAVNPELVQFRSLRVRYVAGEKIEEIVHVDHDDEGDAGTVDPTKVSTGKTIFGASIPGEKRLGRCHLISVSSFPTFNIEDFGDGGIGQCLLKEYAPKIGTIGLKAIETQATTFLGKKITLHKLAVPAFKAVETQILSKNSPVVKAWVQNFVNSGAYVPADTMKRILEQCIQPGKETWVVTSKDGTARYRLLTRVLKNLNGNHDGQIRGDIHSLGIAIDMYATKNWDYIDAEGNITRPLVTQIPAEVAEAFYNNKFHWLGASAGRDAMHFQYYGSTCFKGQGNKFPSGTGCCNLNPDGPPPLFNKCMAKGGKETSYYDCLGPAGKPGSSWIKKTVEPK